LVSQFFSGAHPAQPWLTSALNRLGQIVDDILGAGMAREKIVIAGFSQGACLGSEFVARNATRYGGLIAFSGGLIGPPGMEFRYSGKLDGTPVFFGGADPDPHVPWERVQQSASVLSGLGAEVLFRRYPGLPHTINRDEIEEARLLIARTFNPAAHAAGPTDGAARPSTGQGSGRFG
jgi:phospholipase/carboxylesterase